MANLLLKVILVMNNLLNGKLCPYYIDLRNIKICYFKTSLKFKQQYYYNDQNALYGYTLQNKQTLISNNYYQIPLCSSVL